MIKQEVFKESLNHFIEDANYLIDEAEALTYVIESVPYAETPAGGMSIFNILRLINHAQNNYYKPVIESVFSENRTISLQSIDHYTVTFEAETDEEPDIVKVLQRIIKHRTSFLNVVENIPVLSWERTLLSSEGETILLLEFAQQLILDERKHLKDIADLVMIYQKEREQQREIDKKASNRQRITNP